MEGSAAAATEEKKVGPATKAGKPQPVQIIPPTQQQSSENNNGAAGAAASETAEAKAAREAAEKAAAGLQKLPEVNDDQLKELLKGKGIELDDKGFDGLKEKLKPVVQPAELTAEEKAKADAAFEKRMLDHFTANGGKIEDFVALKQVASADLKDLSAAQIHKEMKDEGFDEKEIAVVLKERYYQLNPEELVRDAENETEEEFAARKKFTEKKIAYGAKKLGSTSAHIKKQAESALGQLREAIQTEDLLAANEAKFSSKVDEVATKLPRKLTFQLGKVNDQEIAPIEYDVTEEDIADVVGTLKDKAKRNKFFFNEDNSLNLDNVASVMLRNKYLESALKASYLEGGSRQVEEFEKIFPGRVAKSIGVGGNNGGGSGTGKKGPATSAGKSEPVRLQHT